MCVRLRRAAVSPSPWGWAAPLALVLVLGSLVTFLVVALADRYEPPPPPPQVDVDLQVTVYGREVVQPRGRSPVPSVMMDLFHRGPQEDLPAEIVQGVTPRTIDSLRHRQPSGRGREHLHLLTFDLPALVPGEVLHSAQLRLTLVLPDYNDSSTEVEGTVRVYWEDVFVSQKVRDQGRVTFNCTSLIEGFHRVQAQRGEELKLLVGVTLDHELDEHLLVAGDDIDNQPLLLLLYSPLKPADNQSRRKRGADNEDLEEESNQIWPGAFNTPKQRGRRTRNPCRRRPLYVEFSDINYDTWIVAPSGYQAYQCIGRCTYPLSDHLSPTKHSIIQTLLHSLHPIKAPTSCCVPTRLDSISILYLDQGVLTYRLSYKDMVVAECGCR